MGNNSFWHSYLLEDIFAKLESSRLGLTTKQAGERLDKYGFNQIEESEKESPILIFFKQFNSILIYILILAALISFRTGHYLDSYVILVVVILNGLLGFIQHFRAEKAVLALKQLRVAKALTLRDNRLISIDSKYLVPGDVIYVSAGDRIPADVRIIEAINVRTQEAALTGESLPVDKKVTNLEKDTPLAERINMLFLGTLIVTGKATAVVIGTGSKTELGKIASEIGRVQRPKTEFEKRIDRLSIKLATYSMVAACLIFIIGIIRGFALFEIFLFGIASAVSAIPEGLPAAIVVVLAVGTQRMAKRSAIIRRLPAVETLGVTNIICTDKTGTLTENKLTVRKIWVSNMMVDVTGEGWETEGNFLIGDQEILALERYTLDKLLRIASLCNDALLERVDNQNEVVGDPTEAALVVAAEKAGMRKATLQNEGKRLSELEFNSQRKYMATLEDIISSDNAGNRRQIYVKGAYEVILAASKYYLTDEVMGNGQNVLKLTSKIKNQIEEHHNQMAQNALRILAIAYKDVTNKKSKIAEDDISNLTFVGLVGMIDPPRTGVKEAIGKANEAGIRTILITGDNRETAIAVALEVGILKEGFGVLSEDEVVKLSDDDLSNKVDKIAIFARTSPETKLRIVTLLQKKGNIVAVTGDGVNDAPALKQADIGVAMGKSGTDVAREAAEIVLADDNFSTIVAAIEEGRKVFINIKQTTTYLIATNAGEIVTLSSAILLGFPLPLFPLQILWMNLVTDGVSVIPLALEPTYGNVLTEPPRDIKTKILSKEVVKLMILSALIMAFGTLLLFYIYYILGTTLEKTRTIAFTTLASFQLFNALNLRSISQSIFSIGLFANPYLWFGIIISYLLQAIIIYNPILQPIFKTSPLNFFDWFLVILVSASIVFVIEIYKFRRRRNNLPSFA